jgi:hypothetical protein
MKVQRVRFLSDWCYRGEVLYARDRHYPLDPDTVDQVLVHGNGELIEIDVAADQHRQELAAAHAAWNARNRASINADASYGAATNPAATLVLAKLAELAARRK